MRRWTVLLVLSIVMMTGYIFWDILSPLSTLIKAPTAEGGLGWTAEEYGFFSGSYSFFNVFLLMLVWGGLILDRMGPRFTGILATTMMLLGATICYYAMTQLSSTESWHLPFVGLQKAQVVIAALGFGAFGVGCDMTGIAISALIVSWFTGRELASAMGIQVALARVGTALAISMSPIIAYHYGLHGPLIVGVGVLLTGFILFAVYVATMDKKSARIKGQEAKEEQKEKVAQPASNTEKKSFSVLAFALIVLLCVCFYSSIRPFLKFSTDVLINKFDVDGVTAGWISSILPYGTIVLTPLFGHLYDRYGHGATLMLAGCCLTLLSHFMLMLPIINNTWIAVIVMFCLGVAFSLVPSAMWASIPQIVPYKRLGISYSIIFYIQNWGLMLTPIWVGRSIDLHTQTQTDGTLIVDYQTPLSIFVGISFLATVVALLLLVVDKHQQIGLERPNIVAR